MQNPSPLNPGVSIPNVVCGECWASAPADGVSRVEHRADCPRAARAAAAAAPAPVEPRIPVSVVPIRYAVAYADSTTSMDFGTDRAELVAFLAERAVVRGGQAAADVAMPAGEGYWAADRRAYAAAVVEAAERQGSAYAFEWDVPAVVTAWQHPVYQGEADDLAAWEAAQAEADRIADEEGYGPQTTAAAERAAEQGQPRDAREDDSAGVGGNPSPLTDAEHRTAVAAALIHQDQTEADAARIVTRARLAASRRAELLASPFPLGRL